MFFKFNVRKYYPSYLLFFIVFFFLFFKKLLIWGEDGSSLWMPFMSEYLKASGHYPESKVIFSGQNLRAIYGELPFWKIFRFFNFSPVRSLNLTYFVFLSCLYLLMLNLFQAITRRFEKIDQIFIFIFVLMSPVVFNRVYAGHFNLLFALLPFFSFLVLALRLDFFSFILSLLTCTFAISIQGHQLLAYYVFYIPCFFIFLHEQNKVQFKMAAGLIILAISASLVFSFVPLHDMANHAIGGGMIRSLDTNIVYSYITSTLYDIYSLIFSEPSSIIFNRDPGFFHEVNYPLSLSVVLFLLNDFKYKKTLWALAATMICLFLFSANIYPFNLISHIPIIKAFRTPQRSLMVPVYFLTFLFITHFSSFFNWTLLLLFSLCLFIISFIPGLELYLFPILFVLLLLKDKIKSTAYRSLMIACSLALLFLGFPQKLDIITATSQNFLNSVYIVNKINNQLNLTSDNKIIHIEAEKLNPIDLTLAANYLGIRTVEGYGHPGPKVFNIFKRVTGLPLATTENSIFFNRFTPNYPALIHELGITDIVTINQQGEFTHKKISSNSL